MGNPNHDPKTGEFSDGGQGGGNLRDVAKQTGLKITRESAHVPRALELRMASSDNASFDASIARLRADKSVGTKEMRAVASEFVGRNISSSNNRERALQKIIDNQALNARQRARMPYQNAD